MGDAALRLVDRLGPNVIDLIPWQEGSVLDICATDAQDQFAASAVGEVVSRQNGKGGVLEVRVVAGVTLPQFREKRILWTAHTWKTAADAHERVAKIFLSHPDLKSRLKGNGEPHAGGIGYGNVSRSINLKDGSQILFFTRSNSAGRGLWADMLIVDEALDVTDSELSALRYTLRTAAIRTGRRAQTIYVSTPPDEETHHNGVVFARLRKRALSGARGVTWIEFSVPSLEDLTAAAEAEGRKLLGDPRLPDPELEPPPETVALWQQGNPSLGYLFDVGTLQADRTESGDRGFLVEGLAAPDYWPDPDPNEAGESAFDFEVWKARRDPLSAPVGPLALGIEVSLRRVATISVCGWRTDGRKHGEEIWSGPSSAAVAVLKKIIAKVDPATLVIDSRGKGGSLLPDIRAEGFDPQVLTSIERSQADEGLVRDIEADELRLPGVPMPETDAAVESATWRQSGDVRYFDRRAGGAGISQVVSLSLARHGLLTVAAQPVKQTLPTARVIKADTAELASVGVGDLSTVGF
ncbi:hypothetical protein [Blastococcus sp. CT_GayMR16]|uniref:hypothetical protein n=1 Tax=Blastococcus sp. CT_GayMR16 TaxID=2559607 RepID=UPI00107308E8|nr:hypothetical protein [Blastococcus sp. CT_GayMR16]TFV90401.1 hypothetical protein E4P38_02880 [Blastococcus sp. CT_GayMR16]